jgi:aspartyl-tRNA synthetase
MIYFNKIIRNTIITNFIFYVIISNSLKYSKYIGGVSMRLKRSHKCGELGIENIGETVILNGWVERIRDLGGIKFGLLRDRYGKVQFVVDPENTEIYEIAKNIGNEYVIAIKGVVRKRPDDAINKNMKTGEIELLVEDLEILSESETPPIYVNKDDDKNS